MPSVSRSTAMAEESLSNQPMRSYMSLPRPPNKSVFRKFFGKKEWLTLSVTKTLTDMCRTQVKRFWKTFFLQFIYGFDGENHFLSFLNEILYGCLIFIPSTVLISGLFSLKWNVLTLMLFKTNMTLSFMEHYIYINAFSRWFYPKRNKSNLSQSQWYS